MLTVHPFYHRLGLQDQDLSILNTILYNYCVAFNCVAGDQITIVPTTIDTGRADRFMNNGLVKGAYNSAKVQFQPTANTVILLYIEDVPYFPLKAIRHQAESNAGAAWVYSHMAYVDRLMDDARSFAADVKYRISDPATKRRQELYEMNQRVNRRTTPFTYSLLNYLFDVAMCEEDNLS